MVYDFGKEEVISEQPRPLLLKSYGIKVFEILEKYEPEKVDNNYSFASKEYIKTVKGWNQKVETYKMVPLKIKVKFWYQRDYEDIIAHTTMSQSVWFDIVRLYDKLKKFNYDIGKYIIYWKKNRTMVWFAFLTEDKWQLIKDQLYKFDNKNEDHVKALNRAICWKGYKAKFWLKQFKEFYGNKSE